MKKLLALCAGMMLFASAATPQTNGLQLAWTGCDNSPIHAPAANFDCAPSDGSIYTLYGTFSLAQPAQGIIAVDNIIDFLFPDPPPNVPTFWQFQGEGCNNNGLTLSHGKPAGTATCGGTTGATGNSIQLCGPAGGQCSSFISAYEFGAADGFPPDRARLFTLIARPAPPITLASTVRHYMFALSFLMDNAPDPDVPGTGCEGCSACVCITWNNAVFYNNAAESGQEAIGIVLSSTDPGSNPNTGANCAAPLCLSVPTRAKTWGQLKSLYR